MKKKTPFIRRKISAFFFCLIGVFFMSCGLEQIIYVEGPVQLVNGPVYNSSDYSKWYFAFVKKLISDSNVNVIGTEVYYKIYSNSSTLLSQVNSITSVNSSSNSTAAFQKMTDTYSYQPLRWGYCDFEKNTVSLGSAISTFFDGNDGNSVRFRLKSYMEEQSSIAYSAYYVSEIFTNGSDMVWKCKGYYSNSGLINDVYFKNDSSGDKFYKDRNLREEIQIGKNGDFVLCQPVRNLQGKYKSFNFFPSSTENLNSLLNGSPESDDIDFCYSDSPDEDVYYVQCFAVTVAFDSSSLSNSYSVLLDLGAAPVRKGE